MPATSSRPATIAFAFGSLILSYRPRKQSGIVLPANVGSDPPIRSNNTGLLLDFSITVRTVSRVASQITFQEPTKKRLIAC
jgi:hypothetical protein